jgi:MSHA biogenesis protein MshN
MLQDLEARERVEDPQVVPHENLRAVHYTHPSGSTRRRLLVTTLVVVALTAAAYHYVDNPLQTLSTSVANLPSVAPPRQTQPPAEPPPAPVATMPVEAPPKPVPLRTTDVPARPVAKLSADPMPAIKPKPSPAPKTLAKQVPDKTAAAPTPAPPPATKTINREPLSDKAVIEKQDRPGTPQDQAEARYREGAQYMSQGRAEDARASLHAALSLSPSHHSARELLVALAMQGGRLQEAQELLAQGLKAAPTRLSFAQLLARVHLEQGNEAQAIVVLENARSAGAGNADYSSFLAALYQRNGRHADAVAAYRESIAVRGQDARSWLGLGISLEATQDGGAAGAYQRALALGSLDANLARYAQQRLTAVKK